jgi:hypothetical protein
MEACGLGSTQISGRGSRQNFAIQQLKLVFGVCLSLRDLAHGPFRGLSWHSPFRLFLLRLLEFPIPMLFAVCHDLVLRYPVTLSGAQRIVLFNYTTEDL